MNKGDIYIKQPLPAASYGYRKMMRNFKGRAAPKEMPTMTTVKGIFGRITGLVSHTFDSITEYITSAPLFDNWYMPLEPEPESEACLRTKKILAKNRIINERLRVNSMPHVSE